MSDLPPPPGSSDTTPSRGPGVAKGCGMVALALVAGSITGSIVTQLSGKGSVGSTLAAGVSLTLVVLAARRWRRVPGFLLGIVWFFAVPIVIFTACVAILTAAGASV